MMCAKFLSTWWRWCVGGIYQSVYTRNTYEDDVNDIDDDCYLYIGLGNLSGISENETL